MADVDVLKEQFTKALNWAVSYTSFYRNSAIDAVAGMIRNQLERNLVDLTGLKTLCFVDMVYAGAGPFESTVEASSYWRNEYFTLLAACKVGSYFVKARGHAKMVFEYDSGRGHANYEYIELESLEDPVVERWSSRHFELFGREPERITATYRRRRAKPSAV